MSDRPRRVTVKSKYLITIPPIMKAKNKSMKKKILQKNTSSAEEVLKKMSIEENDTTNISKADTLEDADDDISMKEDHFSSLKDNLLTSDLPKFDSKEEDLRGKFNIADSSGSFNGFESSSANSGSGNSGSANSGSANSGSANSGSSGSANSGSANSGSANSGNSGSANSGSANSGSANSGNSGSANSGSSSIMKCYEDDDSEDNESQSFESYTKFTYYITVNGTDKYDEVIRKKFNRTATKNNNVYRCNVCSDKNEHEMRHIYMYCSCGTKTCKFAVKVVHCKKKNSYDIYTRSKHKGSYCKKVKKQKKGLYFKIKHQIQEMIQENPDVYPSDILSLIQKDSYPKKLVPTLKQVINSLNKIFVN
jgi:hypothetical protein